MNPIQLLTTTAYMLEPAFVLESKCKPNEKLKFYSLIINTLSIPTPSQLPLKAY